VCGAGYCLLSTNSRRSLSLSKRARTLEARPHQRLIDLQLLHPNQNSGELSFHIDLTILATLLSSIRNNRII
jgi:hypothetical protein